MVSGAMTETATWWRIEGPAEADIRTQAGGRAQAPKGYGIVLSVDLGGIESSSGVDLNLHSSCLRWQVRPTILRRVAMESAFKRARAQIFDLDRDGHLSQERVRHKFDALRVV